MCDICVLVLFSVLSVLCMLCSFLGDYMCAPVFARLLAVMSIVCMCLLLSFFVMICVLS